MRFVTIHAFDRQTDGQTDSQKRATAKAGSNIVRYALIKIDNACCTFALFFSHNLPGKNTIDVNPFCLYYVSVLYFTYQFLDAGI